MSTPIALVCGADNNYAMPLGTMLYSAGANLSPDHDLHIFVVAEGLSAATRRRIESVAERIPVPTTLRFVKADLNLEGVSVVGHLSLATYYRLLAPYIVPDTFDRAIYLDCDVIVQDDLSKVWTDDLDGYGLAAVPDYIHGNYGTMYSFAPDTIGIRPEAPYFNAGVLLINLEYWRAHNVPERALEFCRRHPSTIDQDGLNVAVVDAWKALSPRWNVQMDVAPSFFGISKDELRHRVDAGMCSVLHFTGAFKPWNTLARQPGEHLFARYLRQSGWFGRGEYVAWSCNTTLRAASNAVHQQLT